MNWIARKYCKREHNVALSCAKIQLGSLEYYRELDPDFYPDIADPAEGQEMIYVDQTGPGLSDASTQAMMSSAGLHPQTFMHGLTVSRKLPNILVFCASLVEEGSEVEPEDFELGYDSSYDIPDPVEFGNVVSKNLLETLRYDDFDSAYQERTTTGHIKDSASITVVSVHHAVHYVKTRERSISMGQMQNYGPSVPNELQPMFIKDEKFAENREYRWAFVLLDERSRKGEMVQCAPFTSKTLLVSISPVVNGLNY